ncbi:MAG: 7TM-DISM domain-containing protein, partial [Bacteroidota bacterium]
MQRNGRNKKHYPGLLLLMFFLLAGCQSTPPNSEVVPPETIQVLINGQPVKAEDTLNLLPLLRLSQEQLDTLQQLTFRLKSPVDLRPLLFLGYAQDVTISGSGPPVRIGTVVPVSKSGGWPEIQFFKRQEGYAPHLPLFLEAGREITLTLSFQQHIQKPTPRAIGLMSPAYLNRYANRGFSHFANGIFQGMIWVLILYHLLLFLSVREASYLWYCAYMVCISALTLGDVGYWQRGLFQNTPLLGWHLFQLIQYITGIMTLVFMRSFVDLKRLDPRLDRTVQWFILGNLAVLALVALWYFPTRDGRG